jgi:hypothetical protein
MTVSNGVGSAAIESDVVSARITGWLIFTASKTSISFLPEDRHATDYDRYPWEALLADDQLLRDFIEHFQAKRTESAKALFSYRIDASVDELDAGFGASVEVIELED